MSTAPAPASPSTSAPRSAARRRPEGGRGRPSRVRPSHRVRPTVRGLLVAAVVAAALGAAIGAALVSSSAEAASAASGGLFAEQTTPEPAGDDAGRDGVRVVLGPGETAWEALRAHAPAGVDHREFVVGVLRANDVDARDLRPGDVLWVEAR